jgi:hypothetical protein
MLVHQITKMSPHIDTILSLCLAQAELSPLHYYHGSVIIQGGKVIGQGFNTYCRGFDGVHSRPVFCLPVPLTAQLSKSSRSV